MVSPLGSGGVPAAVTGTSLPSARSRQLRPPRPDHPVADLSRKRIKCRPVLGGLINEYERAA